MMSLVRRRLGQIQQVGPRAAIRITASRCGRGLSRLCESMLARVIATGMNTIQDERPPSTIVPRASFIAVLALEPFSGALFDFLGAGQRHVSQHFHSGDFPRPWRLLVRRHIATNVEDQRCIDWQIDPISGFRWRPSIRSSAIRYGDQPCVEVKWPWELGRLQHLPAIAVQISDPISDHGVQSASLIQDHIVDFVRSNPPGFGVQWLCPMDVGIRIANLLVAVDLARASGVEFEHKFLQLVAATARDHGRHITRHLEWGDRLCSNHYLANVAGLLFAGAYLGDDSEGEDWVAFAGRELVLQVRNQFHAEGSNFEASTCYHRLSAEMIVYSAALIMWISRERPGLAKRWWSGQVPNYHPSPAAPPTACIRSSRGILHPFDADALRRISGMGSFTRSLLRADGSVPQIGDNDSGRFMRLQQTDDPAADLLDHTHLCHAVDALFGRPLPEDAPEAHWLSKWIGRAQFDDPDIALDDNVITWAQFGLYVWKVGRMHVTFRCGHVGQCGNGGHAHCDQLSITLAVDGVSIIDDPGTGVYTPNPELRNRFRGSQVHSTIHINGMEQGSWLSGRWGLFAMKDISNSKLLAHSNYGASASMYSGKHAMKRTIQIFNNSIDIQDEGPETLTVRFILAPDIKPSIVNLNTVELRWGSQMMTCDLKNVRIEEVPWSDRYGVIRSTKCLVGLSGQSRFVMSE